MARNDFEPIATDKVIHERGRLLILTYLASSEKKAVSFSELQEKLGFTSGNLSVQLKTLKKAEYVTVDKQFKDNKPLTTASITPPGRKALSKYLEDMQKLIQMIDPKE